MTPCRIYRGIDHWAGPILALLEFPVASVCFLHSRANFGPAQMAVGIWRGNLLHARKTAWAATKPLGTNPLNDSDWARTNPLTFPLTFRLVGGKRQLRTKNNFKLLSLQVINWFSSQNYLNLLKILINLLKVSIMTNGTKQPGGLICKFYNGAAGIQQIVRLLSYYLNKLE